MAEWLRQWGLRDMKCTLHDLEVLGSNPGPRTWGLLYFFPSCTCTKKFIPAILTKSKVHPSSVVLSGLNGHSSCLLWVKVHPSCLI